MLSIQRIINDPVPSNCFVLFDKAFGRECIIVDPGSKNVEILLSFLKGEELCPIYIVLTHEHFDHCWGVNELVDRFKIPIVCSKLCVEFIRLEKRNCSVFYDNNESFVINGKSISVESLDYTLPFLDYELHFFASPGHSDAGICFSVKNYLFTGDTLIKDLRTVTKLPTGSVSKLRETLNTIDRLKGRGFVVFPGHGEVFHLDDYDVGKALKI